MSSEHLDHTAIATLKEVMEDDFQLLIDTFVNDSKERLQVLAAALAAGDAEEVRRSAHGLKGSSSNVGALRLAEICFQLEEAGRENRLDGMAEMLADAEAEYQIVHEQLEAL